MTHVHTKITVGGAALCLGCNAVIERLHHQSHDVAVQAQAPIPLRDNHTEYSTDPLIVRPVAQITSGTPVPVSAWMDSPRVPYRRTADCALQGGTPLPLLMSASASSSASRV
jgi:hypothetical protein